MILVDVLLYKDPDPGDWKVSDPDPDPDTQHWMVPSHISRIDKIKYIYFSEKKHLIGRFIFFFLEFEFEINILEHMSRNLIFF